MAPIARREIASLRALCLRSVGPNTCNPEKSFAPNHINDANEEKKTSNNEENLLDSSKGCQENEKGFSDCDENFKRLSSASKLLLALNRRPIRSNHLNKNVKQTKKNLPENEERAVYNDVIKVPITRLEYGSGQSGTRRFANDLDISSPWISAPLCHSSSLSASNDFEEAEKFSYTHDKGVLVIENGNPGLDCLQSYIDALVDLGRMSDTRLGKHFFTEWKRCVVEGFNNHAKYIVERDGDDIESTNESTSNKRKNINGENMTTLKRRKKNPKGSLSLFNCASASTLTFQSMRAAGIGDYLDVLDLSGVHSLTDRLFTDYVVKPCPNIRRLSLKNCRRITGKSVRAIAQGLTQIQAIDIGGSFNVTPNDMIELARKTKTLTECYASGLGWSDAMVQSLMESFHKSRQQIVGLSVGFSPFLTIKGFLKALAFHQETISRLGLHFCDACIDSNIALAELGTALPRLNVLDIRGCNGVNSITPFMDARAIREDQDDDESRKCTNIFILARYSNLSRNSLDETNTMYPGEFECIIDGGGVGKGIKR